MKSAQYCTIKILTAWLWLAALYDAYLQGTLRLRFWAKTQILGDSQLRLHTPA